MFQQLGISSLSLSLSLSRAMPVLENAVKLNFHHREVLMEKNPSRLARKNQARKTSRAGPASKSRYAVEDGGDLIECSWKYCRSCTGGLIADCVAVCCCPCAVVNFLALALVKVPWMMGRRCLGLGKRKPEMKRKCKIDSVIERNGSSRKGTVKRGTSEISHGVCNEEEEEDRVWLELAQVGHLGFGRSPSQGKGK